VESLMPENDGLLRICCLAPSDQLGQYAGLQLVSWGVTSRARIVAARYGAAEAPKEIDRADLVYLDCSSGGVVPAHAVRELFPDKPRKLVCSAREQGWMKDEPKISLGVLTKSLVEWLSAQIQARKLAPPAVTWDPDVPELDLLEQSIDWCIGPVLELYFPEQPGPAHIHYVGGGLSGTPLVRVEFEGNKEQYYLKFFEQEDEFKAEWSGHESAFAWLGEEFTVKLRPIPGVAEDAMRQLEGLLGLNDRLASPVAEAKKQQDAAGKQAAQNGLNKQSAPLAAVTRKPLYPVCYESARASKTLKAHFQGAADTTFSPKAYAEVVDLLRVKNSPNPKPLAFLYQCPDYGPPAPMGVRGTILDTLRSSEYQAFIKHALQDLTRWKGACNSTVDWVHGSELLNGLLKGALPGKINKQYSLVYGHSHGDANSRNFLFSEEPVYPPYDLQVIDCGCHHLDAPLLFDPAQLESDLKVNLMASEAASGYEEIDAAQLPQWIEMEKQSLDAPFTFTIPTAGVPESMERAYKIVQVIRGYVQRIPSKNAKGQPDPIPYFYFLLYWTLRKLRHPAVPPTKRLYAMASVFLLLERLQ
jgi:hypothetical protein